MQNQNINGTRSQRMLKQTLFAGGGVRGSRVSSIAGMSVFMLTLVLYGVWSMSLRSAANVAVPECRFQCTRQHSGQMNGVLGLLCVWFRWRFGGVFALRTLRNTCCYDACESHKILAHNQKTVPLSLALYTIHASNE